MAIAASVSASGTSLGTIAVWSGSAKVKASPSPSAPRISGFSLSTPANFNAAMQAAMPAEIS